VAPTSCWPTPPESNPSKESTVARTKAPKHPGIEAQKASGDWNPLWSTLEQWDPDFMEAYLQLRNVPFRQGPLPRKTKELILIAINAATTHLYAPGVRRHIRNALQHGATRAEILETIQLTTVLGIHACNLAVPILEEELASMKPRALPSRRKASPKR
jgi:alkylhydroperoxidase/carboxymuconolactone decarboxylase family protein YurZ